MARKSRYDNELLTNRSGVGYSQPALDALKAGNYGRQTGRKAQYNTSQEQTQQAKELPVLKGVSIPTNTTNDFESSFSRKNYVDTDNARRKYAERIEYKPLGQENQFRNDDSYVVKRDRYDKLMKNGRLANDIKTLAMVNYNNANQDATVSQEWADEYGAKKLTGGYTKQQFIDTLSRRYDLTPEELNDMALTFHSDSNKQEVANYGKQLEKLGKEHEAIGSLGSFVGTIGSGVEGGYNALVGTLTNDDRYLSNMFSTTKNSPREGVKQNIKSNGGKTAYDVVMGLGDMAAGAAVGSAPAILAGNTANEAISSAIERGSGTRRSALYGTAAGVTDYITNTIGLGNAEKLAVESIKKTGIKQFLKNMAKAGAGEAGENVIQDVVQSAFDAVINGKNAELIQSFKDRKAGGASDGEALGGVVLDYIGQLTGSAALGFGMGSLMQGGKSVLPQLKSAYGKAKNGKIEDFFSGNEDVQRIVNGKVPEVTSDADLQRAQAQQTEAVNEINRLNEQLPDLSEVWGRTADGMIPADSYARGQEYNDLSRDIDNTDAEIERLKDQVSELRKELLSEQVNKTPEERTSADDVLDMFWGDSEAQKSTNRGEQIEAQISELQEQIEALKEHSRIANEDRDYIKSQNRLAQLENFEQSEFIPATRDDYAGFSTTKGVHNDLVAKGKAKLVEMSPEDYIRRCVYEIFEGDNATLESTLYSREQSKIDKYAQQMREGVKFDTPYLDYTGSKNQEGLHRALAAMEAGIDVMPVVVKGSPDSDLGRTARDRMREIDYNRMDRQIDHSIDDWLESGELDDEVLTELHPDHIPVDNNTLSGYNDVTKGVPAYDEVQTSVGNDGAGSKGILRDVRSEGRLGEKRFATGVEGREYLPADRLSVADELEQNPQVFDEDTKGFFDANNIPYEDFYENTDADLFSRALSTAIANNPNGAAVDPHDAAQIQDILDRGGSTFMTADGTAGGAVEDGNLTAVFKDSENNDTPRMGSTIALAGVKNGAIKGDCFGIFLVNTYSRAGFEPVGRMEYGYGFNEAMDAQVRDQLAKGIITKEPDVYALKLIDGYDYDTAVHNYNFAKRWTQEELDALPLYDDYNKMLDKRDELIQQGQNEKIAYEDIGLNGEEPVFTLEAEPEPRYPFVQDGRSRVVTKSAINANIISRYDYDNSPVLQEIAKYAKANNEESYNKAMENVKNNGEKLLAEYNDGTRAIDNDQDVDQAMILLQNLSDQMRTGENVEAERNLLLSRLRAAGTKWGQNVQAFAKWNDTPDGLLINGERITSARTKDWADKNVKQAEANEQVAEKLDNIVRDYGKISNGPGDNKSAANTSDATSGRLNKALRNMGFDGTIEETPRAPKTHEQYRAEVENSIRKEFSSVDDLFNDSDFEYLTSLVENNVPVETITDEIEHRLNYGEWYTIDESTPVKKKVSSKLASALAEMGDDSLKAKNQKPDNGYPAKSHATYVEEVKNTLDSEASSLGLGSDTDIEFMAIMLEEGVPKWKIADEIQHRLLTGEWYTLDESTPIKKSTSSKLTKILKNMGNDALKSKNIVPELEGDIKYPKKSHATIAEEVKNTLANDPAAVDLDNPTDVDFIATMIEEKVPDWQIEDEINHRLMTGEWYTLDESVEEPKSINQKLQNALNSLVEEEVKPEKPVLTREELREQVKNTLDNEMASNGEFTDADIDYLTNLIDNGATKQELAQALNTKMATGAFAISAETQTKVNDLFEYASRFDPDSKEACEAKAAAYKLIADEVVGDASAFDKFEAWRYLAMLGNPKTMLRNFVGNTMFNTLTSVSNGLAGIMEAGADKLNRSKFAKSKVGQTLGLTGNGIQRTKSVLLPKSKDKGLVKAAWDDALAHRYKEITGSKYEKSVKDQISQSKSVFNSKWAQLYEKATDAGISDMLGVRTKYATSLAGYLKANGIDDGIFKEAETYSKLQQLSRRRVLTDAERAQMESAKQAYDTLEKARDYAVKQADYATFHEDNAVASWLSEMSRKAPGPLKWLIEGTIPFKKTPANIVRSGEEYSPFGAINSIAKTGKLIYENTGSRKGNLADTYTNKKGKTVNKTLASDVIESWSKTISGSMLMMLGYYLKNKGILNSSRDAETYQDQLEGKQNYSITINGHTYTIDWAAPASMALLMGAELSKIVEDNAIYNKSVYDNFSSIVDTVNSLIDPVIETSMMQGIKDTLEAAANATQYSDAAKKGVGILGAVASNTALNYMSQAIPTLSGQVARVVDPTRRSTDTVASDPVMASIEKQGRKTMNKLPFVSMLNNPYIDTRGQQQLNSPSANPLVSIPYQMLSPGYLQEINQTDADKSAREVYNGLVPDIEGNMVPQRDKGVFSQWKSKVTVDNHKFTPDEMYIYRQEAGGKDLEIRNALANEEWFKNLDVPQQTEILKKVNTLVDKIGKEAVGYPQTGKELEVYNNAEEGNKIPSLLDYLKGKGEKKEVEAKTGLKQNSKASEKIVQAMDEGNQEEAETMMDAAEVIKKSFSNAHVVDDYYKAQQWLPEVTPDQFVNIYKEMDTNQKQSIAVKELESYINNHFGAKQNDQAQAYWNAFYGGWTNKAGDAKKLKWDGNQYVSYY